MEEEKKKWKGEGKTGRGQKWIREERKSNKRMKIRGRKKQE